MPATARRIVPPAPDDHSLPADDHADRLARLPAERQRQLRDLLGQLLARLLAATRGEEAGHE